MNTKRIYTPAMRAQNARIRSEKRHERRPNTHHGTTGSDNGDPAVVPGLWGYGADVSGAPDHSQGYSVAKQQGASQILRAAAEVIEQRAALRDLPNGERSMLRTVTSFNALRGTTLSELDGWIFMCCLKLARGTAGEPHLDDFTDLAGYAALAGEGIAP